MTRKNLAYLFVSLVFVFVVLPGTGSVAFAAAAGPEQGLVIFHRASGMKAKAIRFNLEQDGRPVGQLLAGSTIELPLAPGSYTFTVRAPSLDGMDYLTLNVEAGKTYRVEGEVLWGWPAGRPKFGNVSESGVATQTASVRPAPVPSVAANPTTISADEAGRLGLRNFAGSWNLKMWSLAADGQELEGKGVAEAAMDGDNAIQIIITEFNAPEFPDATGGGRVLMGYEPGRGFSLRTELSHSNEILKLTGRYEEDSNKYVFYLIGGSGGQIATGIKRTSVRIEIRSLDNRSWVAETFASVDGESIQVQSSRFTLR